MRALVTAEFPAEALDELTGMGFEPVHAGWGVTRRALEAPELIAALAGAAILICEVERVDASVLDAATSLRLVASCRADPTNVDIVAARDRGVTVLRTPGRNAISVADFTIALLLTHLRHVCRSEAHLRRAGWSVDGESSYFHFRGPELAGRTIGLVGLGAVGRLVARRATGFDLAVVAHDPFVAEPPPDVTLMPLDALLERSDFVSIHCPLTPDTLGMIGARELGRMRREAVIVNTARAAVIDESALLEALRTGAIAGAALDVFWEEPLRADHPILTLPSVTVTPHVAGASQDVPRHHARQVLDDIARWLAGQPLRNAVPAGAGHR